MGRTGGARQCIALALVLSLGTAASPGLGASRAAEPDPERPSTVVVRVQDGGFHWVDAGVGAVAALATTLLAFGLVLALRSDRAEDRQTTRRSSERERS